MSGFQQKPQSVHQEVSNKNQIGKINERIKALLQNKKQGYSDQLSVYLRVRNKQAKIKRTKQLRKKHLSSVSEHSQCNQMKRFSIQNLRISSNYSYSKQKRRLSYINQLKQFEQEFTKGKMDDKYEQMLNDYINYFSQTIDNNKDEFIKKATKDIKQKLFAYYLSQGSQKLQKHSCSFKQIVPLSNSPQPINSLKFKDTINESMRLKSQHHYSKHLDLKRKQVPYILQSPSRYNQLQSQSIQQSFMNQMENIHHSNKINEKKRRIKEQTFLIKLKELNNPVNPLIFKR